MTTFLLGVGVVIAVVTVAGVARIARGPRVFDRVLGASLVSINGLLLLLVVGFLLERVELFIDLAIAFALLGFLVPLATGRLVRAERQREGDGR